MIYKTEAEVALMKEAALLVSKALAQVAGFINAIQAQAVPQIEQARTNLEALEKATKDES